MTKDTTALGNRGEDVAADYLTGHGYRIVERNHRTRFAELDIIAADKSAIVFVEVKYRKHAGFGGGAGAITTDKIRRLGNAAQVWLAEHESYRELQPRIDVITLEGSLKSPDIEHIENVSIDS